MVFKLAELSLKICLVLAGMFFGANFNDRTQLSKQSCSSHDKVNGCLFSGCNNLIV